MSKLEALIFDVDGTLSDTVIASPSIGRSPTQAWIGIGLSSFTATFFP